MLRMDRSLLFLIAQVSPGPAEYEHLTNSCLPGDGAMEADVLFLAVGPREPTNILLPQCFTPQKGDVQEQRSLYIHTLMNMLFLVIIKLE